MSESNASGNYIDFHCHPAMKPMGKSFKRKPKGKNNKNPRKKNSIWHYNPPSLFDKLLNYISGLTKFSQANFTALGKGEVTVICASLYPIEKWFFQNKISKEIIKDMVSNFATGVSKKRVDHIQKMNDYYKDLILERDFYHQLEGKKYRLSNGEFRYKIVNSYKEIEDLQKKNDGVNTICIVFSIEGLHVLNSDIKGAVNEEKVLANLKDMKSWKVPPLFVSVAHHFWNDLCGHAKSFSGIVEKFVDQSEGINTGFTELGWKVLLEMLSEENGKRIHADIKHMSTKSRREYYNFIEANADYNDLPIIVSHGAVNGKRSFEEPVQEGSSIVKELNDVDINIFNEEVERIAKSKGILGLQLDERRLGSEETIKSVKKSRQRRKILHNRAKLLWNQVQHIVELLDAKDIFAWDCMAIGSDFDGIIDPLNGYWTSEELPYLESYLERHAYNFLSSFNPNKAENMITADEAVDRVMSENGRNFLKRYFV